MGLIATAIADGVNIERGADTPANDSTYAQDAIETQRDSILKVGASDGSGLVRGVHVFQGDAYAFRNNTLGTECLMWKSTTDGWVQQDLGNRVSFTLGTTEFLEGETLTQSGTTSIINRVIVQSGTWAGNDAAGYLIIGDITSSPYAVGVATSASGSATLSGAETANTLQPGGRFEFENYNFYGTTFTKRMYGVDGVGTAFEWDGSTFVPFFTGNIIDAPIHLAVNEYHLQLVFANGSLQNSSTGLPYLWAGLGAAEIGCGDDIIGLKKEVGVALAIVCRNRTLELQGKNTDAQPWDLKTISEESGGIEWTVQRIGKTRFLDDRGFTELRAVQAYGDFDSSTYSQLIEPLIQAKKESAVSSIIVKSKNQLRTFFNDGTGIIATFNDNKLAGFTTIRYINAGGTSIPVRCTANGESNSGSEIMFFGSDDGYVYQMDKGPSFDGGAVDATFVLVYNNLKTPSYDKQFKKVVIEADGSSGTSIEYNVLLDYSSGRAPAGITLQETLAAGGAYWNDAVWNAFNWAAEDVTQIEGNIDGVGRNIGLQISSSGTYVEPHTLYGVTYHYIKRKLVR
ncbi:MAG: hypothetical protein DRI65_12905 [Chloroflexota bacterium]|nr:MAG: hypothetical protein DRI65_12905 [Chloroflexota bacterium]